MLNAGMRSSEIRLICYTLDEVLAQRQNYVVLHCCKSKALWLKAGVFDGVTQQAMQVSSFVRVT
jgi:hypothetical protein